MMPIEALTQHDKDMMSYWINQYGYTSDSENANSNRRADLDYLLRFWNSEKQRLFEAFGNQLIVSYRFEYEMPIEDIMDKMDEKKNNSFSATYRFTQAMRNLRPAGKNAPLRDLYGEERWVLNFLYTEELTNNRVNCDFEFPMPEGKILKINAGAKVTKILGKIAKAYGLEEEYEAFRIEHSQVLNQKRLSGEFCLSIHPMDYMTMSDNDCDWSSCMSWTETGCYRRGTIECMNSPLVVVGYLKADRDMTISSSKDYYWNNKKWRSLFLVGEGFITSVKGYPYYNAEFSDFGVKKLKEMVNNTFLSEPFAYTYDHCAIYKYNSNGIAATNSEFRISFETSGDMYNDFGCQIHHGAFDYDNFSKSEVTYVDYSGRTMCIHCGEVVGNVDFPSMEEELCCCNCSYTTRCISCDNVLYSDEDIYYLDGEAYCHDCYCENKARCALCGEEGHQNRFYKIYVLDDEDSFDKRLKHEYDYFYVNNYYIDSNINNWRESHKTEVMRFFNDYRCLNHQTEWWSSYYYVYRSDFTELGLKHIEPQLESEY